MATQKWVLDPTHSELGFKVKHLMITNVSGSFGTFSIEADSEGDDFTKGHVTLSVDTSTVNTGNEQRDGHLRAGDFFDVENHPKMTFKSTQVIVKDDSNYNLTGDLTIRGVTKPITVNVECGGIAKDPWGNTKAGFTINGKFNRKDFGLEWNAATETGGLLVSEDVRIHAEIQLVKA
jgi:polyisoprenoid-binding protein YceI